MNQLAIQPSGETTISCNSPIYAFCSAITTVQRSNVQQPHLVDANSEIYVQHQSQSTRSACHSIFDLQFPE